MSRQQYKEVDVPPHIVNLFNKVFDEGFRHIRVLIDRDGIMTDEALWVALVEARKDQIGDFEEADDEDEVHLTNHKKITWH